MESHISIIRFVSNPLSEESIALGLVVVSNNEVYFKLSQKKIKFAQRLNPLSAKLLSFSLTQLQRFISKDLADQSNKLIKFDKVIDSQYLNRLSVYNNGIIQFSKPSFIKASIDANLFEEYFQKIIGDDGFEKESVKPITELKKTIEDKIYKPLEAKIDVDYTLKKGILPTLFFDFHVDGIGVNGAMYAAKSVDFNTNKPISDIRAEISEYESVIERLNTFAKSKEINGTPNYYLVADQYEGKTPSYLELYSLLKGQNMPYFTLISSKNLDEFVKKVERNNVGKFSSLVA